MTDVLKMLPFSKLHSISIAIGPHETGKAFLHIVAYGTSFVIENKTCIQ
jgi:hypothetical protein